jgi:hypothetical protein
MKLQENGGSCTVRSFIFYTLPPNIIRYIKSRRLRWVGHVACMGEECVQARRKDHLGDQGIDGRM